jgi:hypothetical protein
LTFASRASTRVSYAAFAAAALWLLALLLPAIDPRGGRNMPGYEILLSGIKAADFGVFAWFANPLFWIAFACALFQYHRAALVISGLSLFFALQSFAAAPLARRLGAPAVDIAFDVGFFVWLAAPALLGAVSAFTVWRRLHDRRELEQSAPSARD